MTNLLQPLLEAIENQLAQSESPEINHAFDRLLELNYSEESAKELLCENLFIEINSMIKVKKPHDKKRYAASLRNLPALKYDIDTAFLCLDRNRWGIPYNAIAFLYNHPQDDRISEKIIFTLENAYDEELTFDSAYRQYLLFPLWYAVVAENHLSEKLIDPVIKLFTSTVGDWDFLNEQGQYLLVKLAEKFPEVTVEKVVTAIEQQVKRDSSFPYLFLYDILFYADLEKYRNRILAILAHPDNFWRDSLAAHVAHLQIKEAIPILQQLIERKKNNEEKYSEVSLYELESAVEQLLSGKVEFPENSKPFFKDRKYWREYYKAVEHCFAEDTEDEFEEDEMEDFNPEPPPVKVQRNDPCPCGSGKKYKKCCLLKDDLSMAKEAAKIPEEIQTEVRNIVKNFNQNEISSGSVYYIPCFEGKYLFMNRFEHGDRAPVFRLTYTGDMTKWKFAIFHWSSETYDDEELFIVPGINQFNGTVESAMKVGMEAYPV